MLNSLWTMILLLSELCKCTEQGFCFSCCIPRKHKTEGSGNSGNNLTRMLGKRNSNRKGYLKKSMKPRAKKRCFTLGKIVLSVIIFLLFSTTFGLGFLTMGYVHLPKICQSRSFCSTSERIHRIPRPWP